MRTEISSLGEFGLIRRLTDGIELKNESSRYGVGDDAAVLSYPTEKQVLITTDLLMEGVHFDLIYVPLKHLGYKAAVVNFSDIYAMNGTPKQITVSLALSKRFSVEDMEELYAGIRLACEEYDVDIIGGDTSSSLTGLAISITCIGEADKDKVVYRNGAKETDLICVTGDLGAAYMGLQLLEREKVALKGKADMQPDFSGKEYLLERQLKPEARRDIIEKLAEEGIQPTSMMDISDGLSSELLHICTQSKVGCRIYEEHIPIDYQTAVMAEEFNMNLTTCALNGGEDYELLFTVPIADHEKISEMEGVKLIGHITKPELGCALITRDGQEFELKAQKSADEIEAQAREFSINIRETLETQVAVEAESEEAALREVERRWKNGEYILDADNFQGVDFWTADHPPVKHIDTREKIDWFELFLSRMRDYSDGEVWGNGDELMCKTEAIADAMYDLLFQLYAAQDEEVVFHTGYYDPAEDARSGEEDRCTGWWYVDCD